MKKIYKHLVNPEAYSNYTKRPVKVVTRQQIGNKIQFSSIRMFTIDKATMRMTNFKNEIDTYTVRHKLGELLWPFCDTLNCENLDELVEEVKKRGLYLYDFWGFVPGSWSKSEPWGEYEMKPDAVDILNKGLGDHFLGFDNGEQDGRYIGTYATMMCPATQDKTTQLLNFQRHFEKIGDSMQHYMSALCSLHYGHYFLKENDAILLGAECAQALPNVNLWYAFNRGAGKQYGVLWYGNASVWNRWGYKNYSESGNADYEWGPEYGTSASLLRRILYIHYTYNCDILGYESGWLYEVKKVECNQPEEGSLPEATDIMADQYGKALSDELTPVGVLQSDALEFVEKQGYPGAMHTPVAVVLDFFTGYTPPRHLYTKNVYQTWGAMPYDEGDYEAHALFNQLFPGYVDAGFYRDERGFLTATPYSDMFDVLLSDAQIEVMKSYNRLVLSGNFCIGAEEFDKIREFTLSGGTVYVFLGMVNNAVQRFENERRAFLGFFGIDSIGPRIAYKDGSSIKYNGTSREEKAFELYELCLNEKTEVMAQTQDGYPVVFEVVQGRGRVCVVAVPYGINKDPIYNFEAMEDGSKIDNVENEIVPMPYDLLETIKVYLGDGFNIEKLVDINPSLCWTVNLMPDSKQKLTVTNNGNKVQRFDIKVCCGTLKNVEELEVRNVNIQDVGYYPFVYEQGCVEGKGNYSIEPLDIRMFVLTLEEQNLEEKEAIAIPDKTAGKYLKLKSGASIREQIVKSPTMDTHFEGVKIDARYFMERESNVLEYEAGFVKRRAMKLIVDFSSLMNHYPDISLLDNIEHRYNANLELIARTLDKVALYDCTHVVINLHRNAENNVTAEYADECFAKTMGRIEGFCKERGMILYVQNGTPARHNFLMPKLVEWIDSYNLDVKIAWNIGHSLIGGEDIGEVANKFGSRISALLLSAPTKDIHGQFIDAHKPLHVSAFEGAIVEVTSKLMQCNVMDFIALDAEYMDFDQIYRDIKCLT